MVAVRVTIFEKTQSDRKFTARRAHPGATDAYTVDLLRTSELEERMSNSSGCARRDEAVARPARDTGYNHAGLTS